MTRILPFAALILALASANLHASADSAVTLHSSSNSVPDSPPGPKALKQQKRIIVETNAPPAGAQTNAIPKKEQSFRWSFSWKGWNGLHYELAHRTPIRGDPLAFLREKHSGTNEILLFHPETSEAKIAEEIRGTNDFRVFNFEELKMSGKIGAKLMVDGAAFVTGSQFKNFDDGVELRRARVYARGDCLLLLPVSYEIEIGYIPNKFYIENTYLAFRDIPWIGDLKIGQYQTPMGLDFVTSSRDTTLMERSAALDALTPGVNAGFQMGRPIFDQRATWKLGFFTAPASQDSGDASKDYGRAITRLTAIPIYHEDAEHPNSATLLHLGLSGNVLYSSSSSVRYRSRPESHIAPYVIDTGNIAADDAFVVGCEAAWASGPLSIQGEYLHSWVHEKNGEFPGFDGVYASASWFLTGESRPYDRQNGCFGRLIPRHNFDWGKGGWGAWEVGARYSYVDLDSADVHGGRLSMLMSGVNWYMHSHVKMRFEYGLGHVSDRLPEGNVNIFQTRMEVDF